MNRLTLAAAASLLLLAAAPALGQDPKAEQQRVDQPGAGDTQQAADTIAGAIRETIRPLEKEPRCERGSENRQSELCAQWKAADAAEASALYALIALFVSAIGTGLLVWTLAETRATSRRELRAYLSVKVLNVRIRVPRGGGMYITFDTVSHNGGMTPAYDCNHFSWMAVSNAEDAERELAAVKPIDKSELPGGPVIHSGDDHSVRFDKPFFITREMLGAIVEGKLSVYVFGVVTYLDTFGTRRRTDYCYHTEGEAFAEATGLRSGEGVPINWSITRYHNTAT